MSERIQHEIITSDDVVEIVRQQLGPRLSSPRDIDGQYPVKDLDLSSNDFTEILSKIRERAGIDFPKIEPSHVQTINDIVELVNAEAISGDHEGALVESTLSDNDELRSKPEE
jgi:acyl carrier protein